MRRVTTIIALILTLLLISPLTYASANEGISMEKVDGNNTRMKYLATVGASLGITDEGLASIAADAVSYSSELTNLLIVAELQQKVNGQWTTVRTYRYFTGDTSAVILESCNVSRGYYYRVVNTTTAYAGSDSETRVATSPEWNFYVPGTYPG